MKKYLITDLEYQTGVLNSKINGKKEDFYFCVSKERVSESIDFNNYGFEIIHLEQAKNITFNFDDIVISRSSFQTNEVLPYQHTFLWKDYEKQRDFLEHWYKWFKPKYREIIPFKFEQLYDKDASTYNVTDDMKNILNGSGFFMKFVHKRPPGKASSYIGDNIYDALGYSWDMIPLQAELLMSKTVKMDNEYRCYIVNGKLSSISPYVDYYDQITEKHLEDMTKVEDFYKELDLPFDKLPKIFVLDIYVTNDIVDVVEFNPYEYAGRYILNDSVKLAKDISNLN